MNHKQAKPTRSLMFQTVFILCLVILPFNLMSIILSLQMIRSLRQTYSQSVMASLNTYTSQLDQRMDNIDYYMYNYPNSDTAFIQMLTRTDDWHYYLHRYNVTTSMSNAMNLSDSADGMFVYIPEMEDFFTLSKSSIPAGRIPKEQLMNLITDPDISNGKWQLYEYDGRQYLLRIVSSENYSIGSYIQCSDLLAQLKSDLLEKNAELFLCGGDVSGKRGYLLCSSPLSNGAAFLVCLIRNSYVIGHISFGLACLIIFFLLSVLMAPVSIFFFRRQINRPLLTLQSGFHELEKGNEDYRIAEIASSSEFADTFQSFNAMAENTSILRRKALEEEKQQHALEMHNLSLKLDNLQLQIRPHFLQNMMNLLFTLVQNHQEGNAKRLILYLSSYFRYMFRYGHELELFDKEINLVKEYLAVSEMHYTNAFTVSWQLDPLLSLMRFPPLLLHNFVENIIQHALIPGRVVHIVIYGEYDEDAQMVTLQVSDDGRGMSEEFADMINRNDFSSVPVGKHIGIRNSINRLEYYYHGKASVSVERIADNGTTITIMVPQNLTMEELE